jgi:hypothetical protein
MKARIVPEITELMRLPSPAPAPQGLAFNGATLWVGSCASHALYAIDAVTWRTREQAAAPGEPFGITFAGDELRVVVGFGDDADDRYICRCLAGHGFKNERIPCPDLSGSYVAFDGEALFLSQAHNMKILALDVRGAVRYEIRLRRRPVGMTIVDGCFYLITGDEQFANLQFVRVDAREEPPRFATLASVPFGARGLAFDGSRFWTTHRRNDEIVAFAYPA